MPAYYAKSHVSLPGGIKLQWNPRSKIKFGQAINWGLVTVIEQDIGSDLKKTWQDGGTLMWADDITGTQEEDLDADAANQQSIKLSSEERAWYRLLLKFIDGMVNSVWQSLLVLMTPRSGKKYGMCKYATCLGFQNSSYMHLLLTGKMTSSTFVSPAHFGMTCTAGRPVSGFWRKTRIARSLSGTAYVGSQDFVGITPLPDAPSKRVTIVS